MKYFEKKAIRERAKNLESWELVEIIDAANESIGEGVDVTNCTLIAKELIEILKEREKGI